MKAAPAGIYHAEQRAAEWGNTDYKCSTRWTNFMDEIIPYNYPKLLSALLVGPLK